MEKQFAVASERKNGRSYTTLYFSTLQEAKDYLTLPGVYCGTVYLKYVGNKVLYSNDPDMTGVTRGNLS